MMTLIIQEVVCSTYKAMFDVQIIEKETWETFEKKWVQRVVWIAGCFY